MRAVLQRRIHDLRARPPVPFTADDMLRRRCRQRIRGLGIVAPVPFTVDALCAAVSRRTGRPIHLVPMPMAPAGPCGLWVATLEADFVVTDPATTPVLRQHIVLHELGHIIFGHRGVLDTAAVAASLDALDPDMVRRVLGRGSFDEADEREAEMCADVLAERFVRRQGPPPVGPTSWH
jgi:hypothetical protein